MIAHSRLWRTSGFRIACALVLLAPLAGLPTVSGGPARALGDGSITIRVFDCPFGVDAEATDANVFAKQCTSPDLGVDFTLTIPNDVYTNPRSSKIEGTVTWGQQYDPVTIQLAHYPADDTAVAFCDDGSGSGQTREPLPDGVTIKQDYQVPDVGLDCWVYLIPSTEPTPTPTPTPTATLTSTPSPTSTPSATATSTESPTTAPTSEIATTPVETPTAESPSPTPKKTSTKITGQLKIRALGMVDGATYSYALAINDSNDIVGISGEFQSGANTPSWQEAVWWDHNGTEMHRLQGIPKGTINTASDNNNHGQIVGYSATSDLAYQAVLWDNSDIPTLLGFLANGKQSQAIAINDAGEIVGVSTIAPDAVLFKDETHPFLWANGVMTDLGIPADAASAYPYDINDSGFVVGIAKTMSGPRAAVWTPDHSMTELKSGTLQSVNNSGIAVGVYTDGKLLSAWVTDINNDSGNFYPLGKLKETNLYVLSINDGGVAVGLTCADSSCNDKTNSTAVLWQNGKVYKLQKLLDAKYQPNWAVSIPADINAHGEIVGWGAYGNDPNQRATQGFLLFTDATASKLPTDATATPTPAPPSELPREILIDNEYYLRDQTVPIDFRSLKVVKPYHDMVVYTRKNAGPDTALYIPVSDDPAKGVVRYLPEQIDRPTDSCPAEDPGALRPQFTSSGITFVFAGYEIDRDAVLRNAGRPGDAYPQYTDPSLLVNGVYKEVFFKVDGRYQRYIKLDDAVKWLVEQLAPGVGFNGHELVFREEVTDVGALGTLVPVGCAGPFRVDATLGEETAPFADLYVELGGAPGEEGARLLHFISTPNLTVPATESDQALAHDPATGIVAQRMASSAMPRVPASRIAGAIVRRGEAPHPRRPVAAGAGNASSALLPRIPRARSSRRFGAPPARAGPPRRVRRA